MDFGKARGSQLLKDVALKNQAMSNALVVRDLDIDQIADNPDNAFLFGMEQSDIEHTAEGIRLNGFHGAVEVFEDGKGGYEMFSGHIRKYGAKQAGLKKIPAIINPMPEETHKRRLLVGANLYGRNKVKSSNPIYTGRQLAYHKETLKMENFHGDIREQLAKEFGISGAQCHRYMALLELIEPLQDIAAQGIAPFSLLSGVKGFEKEKQEKLAEYIMEKYTENGEPLTSKELRTCMDKMTGESPVPGQMEINDYNISSETVSMALDDIPVQAEDDSEECDGCMFNNNPEEGIWECHPENGEHKCYGDDEEIEVKEQVDQECAYDRLPIKEYGNCDDNCFYCRNEECNGSQVKRENCIYDSTRRCNMYDKHEIAISMGIACDSSCCNDCNKECNVRCIYAEQRKKSEEREVVHDEQSKIPSSDEVLRVYEHIGCEIKNYYKLKKYLIEKYGKAYSYFGGPGVIGFDCSPRGIKIICHNKTGIKISNYDEITWTMFLDILSEQVQLDKTKQTETSEEASGVVSKSDLEKRIYKLEEELSNADSIQWSNAEDAKKIIKSLIAMLEDEVDAIG